MGASGEVVQVEGAERLWRQGKLDGLEQ